MDARFLDILAACAAIIGGGLLLTFTSADPGTYSFTGHNFFETASHGVGLYLIARGIMLGRMSHLATTQRDEATSTTDAINHLIEVTRQTSGGYQAADDEDTDTGPWHPHA